MIDHMARRYHLKELDAALQIAKEQIDWWQKESLTPAQMIQLAGRPLPKNRPATLEDARQSVAYAWMQMTWRYPDNTPIAIGDSDDPT